MCLIILIKTKQIFAVAIQILLGNITFYPNSVKLFEKQFSKYIGSSSGLMFSNATSALEAAMFAVGVNSKSLVGTSPFVIPSSYCSAHKLGARIEFIDIDKDSLNINYQLLITNQNPKITTLVVTHFYGNPCDMRSIMSWADKHNIMVIEDCSHAHGATFGGRMIGSWGHVAVFSLQGSKAVSAGEGGIAITNSDRYYAKMAAYGHQESYKQFGIDRDKYDLPPFGYGSKMRAHPLGAVLASVDFKHLDYKNKIFEKWFSEVNDIAQDSHLFSLQKINPEAKVAGFACGLALIINAEQNVNDFVGKLKGAGVNHFRRDYSDSIKYFSTSREVEQCSKSFENVVFIPFYQFIDFRRWTKLVNILRLPSNAK